MSATLPPQTVIRFSKWKILWFIAMMLVCISGMISLFQGGTLLKIIMAVICVFLGAFLAYFAWQDIRTITKPRLIMCDKGIQVDQEFYTWKDVDNERVSRRGSVKPDYFLYFETPNGNRSVHLAGLDRSPEQIMELLKRYKERKDGH